MIKKRSRKGAIIAIALFLILIGGSYFGYQSLVKYDIKPKVELAEIQKNQTLIDAEKVDYNDDLIEEISADEVVLARARNLIGKSDSLLIGGMAIPSVTLNLGVYRGFGGDNQYLGACTYYDPDFGTERKLGEGNYILIGHNLASYDGLFAPMKRVKLGSMIYLTDYRDIYTYQVIENQVVNQNRFDVTDETEGSAICTLITCYGGVGTNKRRIVTGKLVSKESFEKGQGSQLF